MEKVELGDKVKCLITGFKGTATCRHTYINGCDRITVSPGVGEDGKLPDECSFDEPQLKVTKKRVLPKKRNNNGGPAKHEPQPKSTGSMR